MQQRWRSKFRALTSSIAFKEHFMGCCFDVRTVLDLAGDALGLFIKMCWGSCCFDLQVHMRVRGGLRLQSHCCGTSLVQKCHHLQVICVSKGLQPWETGKKKKASDGQDCSACAEIYGDVADVFSGTKINRVIYGDWFGFWKLITDGWFFLFFFFFSWKRSWAITCQWWNHMAKSAAFLCAEQANSNPSLCENGCCTLLPVLCNSYKMQR